ncbi:hypothetical protein PInf_017261 [Phytophthora infestans]|nr:hypothetical protein PInf_017261 [Phytophthora infestans]
MLRKPVTLTAIQNEQLRRVHLQDLEETKEEETSVDPQSAAAAAKTKGKRQAKSCWTRKKYQTRSASRKAASLANNGDS